MQQNKLTLYTTLSSSASLLSLIRKRFEEVTETISEEKEHIFLTLQDHTIIKFTVRCQEDHSSFIEQHITGMMHYFNQIPCQNKNLHEYILHQISHFNCVTGIVFDTDENTDRTHYLINTFFDIAQDTNGFLLYPNRNLYNGQRQLVLSAEGESELTEYEKITNPVSVDIQESQADLERKERSIRILKEKNIPFIPHLQTEVTEQNACLKTREEMVQRAACLFAVAVYSEVLLSEKPDPEEALFYLHKMDEIYGIRQWLTPAETAYISKPAPDEQECIQFVWRYECCAVLLWAAGVTEELPFPTEISDVPVLAAIFWQHQGIEHLLSKGIPRDQTEILDAADLTLRYDWACVNARIQQKENPAGLDGGIVMERHYTFNWITGANEGAEWDDIQPHT